MYCVGCGHLIADNAEACEKCRLSLTNASETNAPQLLAAPSQHSSRVWVFILILGALFIGIGQVVKYNGQKSDEQIKDVADAANTMLQIVKDISALHRDPSSQPWDAFRANMLSRESYLTDLNAQNDRFQSRITLERGQNLGKDDPCEQWAFDELGPALKDYVAAINGLFPFVKSTPRVTEDNNKTLQKLASSEDNALGNLQQAFAHAKAKGCYK
jgi:hypothetical protein